ncbi:MAG: hypothetical protein KDD70_16770 [Bdellovibrionales bacterium]|nr:hypothetical protein [Bdellovibrionales bacterium]
MSEEKGKENYRETLLRIQKMNPGQKVTLAQKGNAVERKILAQSGSVEILLALVNGPKVTEQEIERISGLAGTPEVVLKTIYSSSRWIRSHRIRLACLKNPRLPPSMTRKILMGLSKQQLQNLTKDPVMPAASREAAKRLLASR